jgi:hypothetical protein
MHAELPSSHHLQIPVAVSLSSPSPSLVVVVIAHVAAKCVGVQLGVGHGQLEL